MVDVPRCVAARLRLRLMLIGTGVAKKICLALGKALLNAHGWDESNAV